MVHVPRLPNRVPRSIDWQSFSADFDHRMTCWRKQTQASVAQGDAERLQTQCDWLSEICLKYVHCVSLSPRTALWSAPFALGPALVRVRERTSLRCQVKRAKRKWLTTGTRAPQSWLDALSVIPATVRDDLKAAFAGRAQARLEREVDASGNISWVGYRSACPSQSRSPENVQHPVSSFCCPVSNILRGLFCVFGRGQNANETSLKKNEKVEMLSKDASVSRCAWRLIGGERVFGRIVPLDRDDAMITSHLVRSGVCRGPSLVVPCWGAA